MSQVAEVENPHEASQLISAEVVKNQWTHMMYLELENKGLVLGLDQQGEAQAFCICQAANGNIKVCALPAEQAEFMYQLGMMVSPKGSGQNA